MYETLYQGTGSRERIQPRVGLYRLRSLLMGRFFCLSIPYAIIPPKPNKCSAANGYVPRADYGDMLSRCWLFGPRVAE
jgi:hypothetical protein